MVEHLSFRSHYSKEKIRVSHVLGRYFGRLDLERMQLMEMYRSAIHIFDAFAAVDFVVLIHMHT